MGVVDIQDANRCSSNIGKANEKHMVVAKMSEPNGLSWIEQTRQPACLRIHTTHIRSFVPIAASATECKIGTFGLSSMLSRDNMIQGKR